MFDDRAADPTNDDRRRQYLDAFQSCLLYITRSGLVMLSDAAGIVRTLLAHHAS